jgi:flagellar basal-body rod protein FlgB
MGAGEWMIMNTSTDRISNLLTNFLDIQSRRTQLAAGNIANADTPGYAARELNFGEYLRAAAHDAVTPLCERFPNQMESPRISVIGQSGNAVGVDGNNVDTAREMSTLAETGTQYLFGTQMLQMRLRMLKTAIREGR